MRHGSSFMLVVLVVLFTVDDSLANVLEQYVLKDGREQCEEIKPYCPPVKPGAKQRRRRPPPKVKPKKRCRRQYRIRTSNRCPFVKRPSCKKPIITKKTTDKTFNNCPKMQSDSQCIPVTIQKGSKDLALLLKANERPKDLGISKPVTCKPIPCGGCEKKSLCKMECPEELQRVMKHPGMLKRATKPVSKMECPEELPKIPKHSGILKSCAKPVSKMECPEELQKITKNAGILKNSAPNVLRGEGSQVSLSSGSCDSCMKKIAFKANSFSSRPKCMKCSAGRIAPHFGCQDSNTGLLGLTKKQIGSENVVLEVKVPTMTQIARMGWNFVTFTTDQCFNMFTKIHEARERRNQRFY